MATSNLPQNTTAHNTTNAANSPTTKIFWFVTIAVILIALGSFALSYAALVELAAANGVKGWLAYIWPLIVDVSVIVFTAAILVAQLQKRGAKLPIALTGFYAVVTITGNVLHAPFTALGWFVAVLPPLSLIAATEMLRAMAHHTITHAAAVTSLAELNTAVKGAQAELHTLTTQIDTKEQQLNTLGAQIETAKCNIAALNFEENQGNVTPKIDALNAAKVDAKQQRLNTLVTFLGDNPQASLTDAAAVVDVTRQTVRRYVTELQEAGKLHKNGNGWEVTR